MQKQIDKYLWDGASNISGEYKLKRIIEYASFPDLISYPLEDFKKYLPAIRIENLRTSKKRKEFIKCILPFLSGSQTWEEIIDKLTGIGKS